MTDPDRGCDFPAEWLIAWRDKQLRGGPAELADAHVAGCAVCRAWLREMDEIDRLLRESTLLDDDPDLRRRIAELVADTRPAEPARAAPLLRSRFAPALLVLLIAVAAGLLLPGPLARAGSSLTDWFSPQRSFGRILPVFSDDARPVVIPTGAATPTSLPFGLALVGEIEGERFYRNDAGLAISFGPNRGANAFVTLPEDPTGSEIRAIGGRDVLVLYGLSRDEVVSVNWQADGVLYTLFVLETPPGGLSVTDALAIAEALMAEELATVHDP